MMIRVNLMPWRERRRACAVRTFQRVLLGSLVLMLVAMLMLDQLARARLAEQVASTARHHVQLQHIDDAQAEAGRVRQERDELLAQHRALLRLRAGQALLGSFFSGLEQSMPGGAQLTEVSLEEGRLRLVGLAASAAVVAQFMRDLEANGVATGLELVFLKRQPAGLEFLLTGDMPRGWS